jgi:parallel beta-helix repeat protein
MSRPALRFSLVLLSAVLAVPLQSIARTQVVHSGQSIAAALAAAHPGDRVVVQPGVYHEGAAGDLNALSVTTDDIRIIGLPRPGNPVVLENAGAQTYGIWVSPADTLGPEGQANDEAPPRGTSGKVLHHFLLTGFTVRGFAGHGVHLACVDDFALTYDTSDGNAVYGLFPIRSTHGLLWRNEITGTTSDAALYIGQSDDVLIAENHVHDNLLGIEVQNSSHCAVDSNNVHANTLGILVDVEQGKALKTQQTTSVGYNAVYENNRANSAEPDSIIAVLPPGIGILLVGADTTTVVGNRVSGNAFAGIGVVSLCLGLALAGEDCVTGIDVDPFADGNIVAGNVLWNNATQPTGVPELDALSADLVWDGTGAGNCWTSNAFESSVPPQLPSCE